MKYLFTLLMVAFYGLSATAQKDQQVIAKGNKLYKQQQFENAATEYEKIAGKSEKNVKARYNMGNALYRANKMEAAQKAYENAAENSNTKTITTNAYYNKGVSLSQQKKLEESIVAYKQTLRLSPGDNDARENLQKALNELKKQEQQKSDSKQDKNKKQDKSDEKNEPEKNKSNLNKKQAEQMLNALRQEEKAIQKDLQKNKNKGGIIPDKDW